MKQDDQVQTTDATEINIATDPNAPRYARVRVLAESGIFKNGLQYDKDSEAVITFSSAITFEKNGDVEILQQVDAPESTDE